MAVLTREAGGWEAAIHRIPFDLEAAAAAIRADKTRDVSRVVDLVEMKRAQYEQYQPVFWRRTENSRQVHTGFVTRALLDAASAKARERGEVQTVVVCGHRDGAKRAMLAAAGYTIASEWYVRPLSSP